jgi:hypothetical protein
MRMKKSPHLGLSPVNQTRPRATPRRIHSQKCENQGAKSETKIECGLGERRPIASGTEHWGGCWIGLISRTLSSTETRGRRFRLFCRTGELTGPSQSEDLTPKKQERDDRSRSIRTFIRSRRGECRDSRSRTVRPRSAPLAPNIRDKVRYGAHVQRCNNAGTRHDRAGSLKGNQ